MDYDVRVEVSNRLFAGYDLILSVGQLVPHEVVGIANYTKNILTGAGGADTINKSHFLGAAYGMERMMGRIDTPVRRLFNYAVETFLRDLPIVYVLTVMEKNKAGERDDHARVVRRRRHGDVHARRAALAEGQPRPARQAAAEGARLSRPARIQEHLARQQGDLPHPHGDGRRRRTHHPRARPEGVRRRPRDRPAHPQVRLPRHAGHAGRGQSQRRAAQQPQRRGASHSRLERRPVPHHLLSRPQTSAPRPSARSASKPATSTR